MSISSNSHEEFSHDFFREQEEENKEDLQPCDDEIEIEDEEEEEKFSTTSIRVLLVDADRNSLTHMKNLMIQFSYQVTDYENGEEAMDFLKKSKDEIDLVIWDFHNHEINGVEALKTIHKEMDLPVAIISNEHEKETVKNSTKEGACDFLVKPVSKEVILVLWQHVFRKRMSKTTLKRKANYELDEDDGLGLGQDNNEEIEEDSEEQQSTSNRKGPSSKKPRMTWTSELHNKFLLAVENFGGIQKAYPKQILKYMQEELKVEGVTRSNVASHLQKHRQNNCKNTRVPEQDLTASKPFQNQTMDLRVSYNNFTNDQTVAAVSLIQYPLNGYNNNHFMSNTLAFDPFHQPQPQPQPYQYPSSYQYPNLVTKQEPERYVSTSSSTMENLDPLLYIPTNHRPYDHLQEYFPIGYNNFDKSAH